MVNVTGKLLLNILKKIVKVHEKFDKLLLFDGTELKYSFLLKKGKAFMETHGFQYVEHNLFNIFRNLGTKIYTKDMFIPSVRINWDASIIPENGITVANLVTRVEALSQKNLISIHDFLHISKPFFHEN